MAALIFDGEVNSLSARQLEFISDVLEKKGFKDNKVSIKTLGQAGDNFVANVKRITVEKEDGSTFRMVAKIAPTNEIARARSGIPLMFMNEGVAYQDILPKLVEQQKSAGVPDDQLFKHAECYGVLLEPPHELVLLEDLQVSNYVMLDRFKPLKNETVRLTIKNFAILHSLSLVFKKENPEIFATFSKKLTDFFGTWYEGDEFLQYSINLENDVLNVLNDEDYKIPVRGSLSTLHLDMSNTLKNQDNLSQSVVIQGDSWTNNIMFRLEEGEPITCLMIDYQLSKVSNPVCDLLYMIFNCTDHATRKLHFREWIDHYHSELDKSLSYFGLDAETVYPRELLDADLRKYSQLFFSLAIMLFSILIRKPEDAAKVKSALENGEDMDVLSESFQTTKLDAESVDLFRSKVMGLVDSYRELGYID